MAKNGLIQDVEAREAWENLTGEARKIIVLLFGLLITPLIVLLGAAYGLRAGIIVGTEKTLELLKGWKA